jgi:O-antigen/teichoic acid export membrane protein
MLMGALIPLYLCGAYCVAALGGMLDFRAFNIVRFATPAIYVAAIVALAVTWTLSAVTAAAGFVVANGIADAVAVALLCRNRTFGRPDVVLAKSALSYGVRAHVGRLSPQSLGADAIVIALLLSSHDVGLFVAAAAFLAAPRLLTASVSMVAFPQVSAAHMAGEPPRLRALLSLYVLAATLPAIALFALAGPIVALLFGGEFNGAAPVLRLLALSAMAMSLRAFPLDVLRGVGRPGITSIAEVANWALFFVAVPAGAAFGGLQGAAAGVAVSSVGSLAVIVLLWMRSGVLARASAPDAPPPSALEATC